MITEKNDRFLLEINTLPGMKEISLLPMGARCAGMDFTTLVGELVSPAISRLSTRLNNGGNV
jgi:D-alanine-D-alanine ligase